MVLSSGIEMHTERRYRGGKTEGRNCASAQPREELREVSRQALLSVSLTK